MQQEVAPQVEQGECWDDITGAPLEPDRVRKARADKLNEFRKHGVYVIAPIEEY